MSSQNMTFFHVWNTKADNDMNIRSGGFNTIAAHRDSLKDTRECPKEIKVRHCSQQKNYAISQ